VCRNLKGHEIAGGVQLVYTDLDLAASDDTLLISYMGLGEPLNNVEEVVSSMCLIKEEYKGLSVVRFGLATSLPINSIGKFYALMRDVKSYDLNVKVHLSLHYTDDAIRARWMPNSTDIKTSITTLELYHRYTGRAVEIHYTLIKDLNDTESDALKLTDLLRYRDIPVKFLFYNEKASLEYTRSSIKRYQLFKCYLDFYCIKNEYYTPPGLDVGASCGQFLLDYYYRYNLKGDA